MAKINLLIVDDEEDFLESISQSLAVRDFNVKAVNRGEKALEAAREGKFDIAIVDLKMPGIDGEETLRRLKEEHPRMEVVILTGHGSIGSAVECTQQGAYKYLQKPCELDELLAVLVEAYKARVLKLKKLSEKHLAELLKASQSGSALGILRRLKEIEKE